MEFLLLIGAVVLYYVIKAMTASPKQLIQKNNSPSYDGQTNVIVTTSNQISQSTSGDDDDLATFRISYGYNEDKIKSKNKTPGKWVKPEELVTLKGLEFTGGNFYIGGKLKALDGYGTEASLVDDSLKIAIKPFTFEDESLGYWPKFSSLTPEGRGAYLSWLSGKRNDPETPLGYVFIYFYGLERRITVTQ